jgi:hypothetical protein
MSLQPLYRSEAQIAKMLGHDTEWLRKNASTLEAQYGFPKIDPAINKRHAPSVEQWARDRNTATPPSHSKNRNQHVENFDAL